MKPIYFAEIISDGIHIAVRVCEEKKNHFSLEHVYESEVDDDVMLQGYDAITERCEWENIRIFSDRTDAIRAALREISALHGVWL